MMPRRGSERFRERRALEFGCDLRVVLELKRAVDIPADHLMCLWDMVLWPTCSHTMLGATKSRD